MSHDSITQSKTSLTKIDILIVIKIQFEFPPFLFGTLAWGFGHFQAKKHAFELLAQRLEAQAVQSDKVPQKGRASLVNFQ